MSGKSATAAVRTVVERVRRERRLGRIGESAGPYSIACELASSAQSFEPLLIVWGAKSRSLCKRLAKRANKKAAQPYRKKKRYHLQRKAAGKNNVRPCR